MNRATGAPAFLSLIGMGLAFALSGCGAAGGGSGSLTPEAMRPASDSVRRSQAHLSCLTPAVFVRLDTEIRGYPLGASGVTAPCVQISGPNTGLVERGALAISVHGLLHSLSFQSDAGLTIHAPDAYGDAAPRRTVSLPQDHVALAIDSRINDYVVASEAYTNDPCWYFVRSDRTSVSGSNCDPNVAAIYALSMTTHDELIVVGLDVASNRSRIDVYASAATNTPRLVRTIMGPATGLPVAPGQSYFSVSYALATDRVSNHLYVYSSVAGSASSASIAEFDANAAGNAAPLRVLRGANIDLPATSFAVNVINVDQSGNLYVLTAAPSVHVAVFGPHAVGNAAPERTFNDPAAMIGSSGASLAVR